MGRVAVIAVEGPSCVGKTTLVAVLASTLTRAGATSTVLPEFSDSPLGRALADSYWVRDAEVPAWKSGVAGMIAYLADKSAVLDSHRSLPGIMLSDRTFLTQRVLGMARIDPGERPAAHRLVDAAEEWRDSVTTTTTLALMCRTETLVERWSQRLGRDLDADERERLAVERAEYLEWFARAAETSSVIPVDMDAAPLGAVPVEVLPLIDGWGLTAATAEASS